MQHTDLIQTATEDVEYIRAHCTKSALRRAELLLQKMPGKTVLQTECYANDILCIKAVGPYLPRPRHKS